MKNDLNTLYDNDQDYDFDNHKKKCNHEVNCLAQYSDKSYFTTNYLNYIRENDIPFPTECTNCHREIRSSATTAV